MAKILCSKAEYDKLSTVLSDSPQYLADVHIVYEIIDNLPTIPEDFRYDTETKEFYVYRNKYTGEEIHIIKDPKTYIITPETPTE